MMFKKVEKSMPYAYVYSLINFPEPSSVSASMFYHFEPDNDFAIRCMPIQVTCLGEQQLLTDSW
jgi:hypothetical protein